MAVNCAVVQMNSGSDRERNLQRASELVAEAAAGAARVVALPENFAFMRQDRSVAPAGEGMCLVFDNTYKNRTLYVKSCLWTRKNRLFIISCTAESEKMQTYGPIFRKVFGSFRVR